MTNIEDQQEIMKLNQKISDVADAVLVVAQKQCANEDSLLGIAALLFAATCLARGARMDHDKFCEGVEIAWRQAHDAK